MPRKPEEDRPVVFYAPIPFNNPDHHENIIVLPLYAHPRRNHRHHLLRHCPFISAVLLLLVGTFYFLYPSDPTLTLSRLHLHRISIDPSIPTPSLSVSLSVLVKVFNPDFFSLRYSSLAVSLSYRGESLGHASSTGGLVKARGTSYVNATLDLDGFAVIHDVVYLIQDLAKGSIPFGTISEIKGNLGLFFLDVPIQASVFCEVYVNIRNQTVVRQGCSPV